MSTSSGGNENKFFSWSLFIFDTLCLTNAALRWSVISFVKWLFPSLNVFQNSVTEMRSCYTFPVSSFLRPSICPPFLPDSHCVTLCSFCVSLWKLGTPNYRGLSIIMYLAVEMYWHTVPPWKKRTPNINWGILLLRSISMFLTVIFILSDLNKYLCLVKKKRENDSGRKKSIWKIFLFISDHNYSF